MDVVLGLDSLSPLDVYNPLLLASDSHNNNLMFQVRSEEEVEIFPEASVEEDERLFEEMVNASHPSCKDILLKRKRVFRSEVGASAAKLPSVVLKLSAGFTEFPAAMRASPRRRSIEEDQAIAEQVEEMLRLNVIVPFSGPCHSQVHLVKRKDGKTRFLH